MTLTSTGTYSRAFEAIKGRLEGHIGPAKILEGFRLEEAIVQPTDGERDLPKIYLTLPDIGMVSHTRNIGDASMLIKVVVSTSRTLGILKLIQAVEKVEDALDKNEAGEINLGLQGTLARPLEIVARDNYATANGLSLNAQLTISVMPKPFTRGNRRQL